MVWKKTKCPYCGRIAYVSSTGELTCTYCHKGTPKIKQK